LLRPKREKALLADAGFRDLRVLYVAMRIFGWIATA
jgi:hypothetical protein